MISQKYQGEPIGVSLKGFTDETKATPESFNDMTLELLLIRVSSDKVIYCIEDASFTKNDNLASVTIPGEVTIDLQPGEYKAQISDVTVPTDPVIGISTTTFTILKSYKKCT